MTRRRPPDGVRISGRGQRGFRLCSAEKEEYGTLPEGTTGPKIRLDTGARRGETA